MKRILALILAVVMTLSVVAACGQIDEEPQGGTDAPVITDAPVVTDPPVTDAPVTDAPVTDPPVTDAPVTDAPVVTDPPATEPTYEVTEIEPTTMKTTDKLNVRKGPGTSYDKVGSLSKGAEVTVVGRVETWYQIEFENGLAFVSSAYLKEVSEDDNNEDVNVPDEDEDPEIDVPEDDDEPVIEIPETPIVNVGQWAQDNGWSHLITRFKNQKYVTVLNQIMEGIQTLQTEIYVEPCITASEVEDFAKNILPIMAVEYCYVKKLSYTTYPSTGVLKSVKVTYHVSNRTDAERMVKELRETADDVLKGLKSSMSDYEKVLYLYDWLIVNSVPDKNNKGGTWATTAYGSIVDGKPTCTGYAKGLFYLLSRAGFDTTFAIGTGTSSDITHIWVKVKIGSSWYNLDPTWDDPITPTSEDKNLVYYEYFLVTDDLIEDTRTSVYDMRFFDDPSCTSTKYDWYRVNDYYASSFSEAEEIVEQAIKDAIKEGGKTEYIRLKFANTSIFDKFKSKYTVDKIDSMLSGGYECVKRYWNTQKNVFIIYRITK